MALWGIATPSMQTLMTQHVRRDEQGGSKGASRASSCLASLIGPTAFTQTFAASIAPHSGWHLPGAPFFLASALVIAAMVVLGARRGRPRCRPPARRHEVSLRPTAPMSGYLREEGVRLEGIECAMVDGEREIAHAADPDGLRAS